MPIIVVGALKLRWSTALQMCQAICCFWSMQLCEAQYVNGSKSWSRCKAIADSKGWLIWTKCEDRFAFVFQIHLTLGPRGIFEDKTRAGQNEEQRGEGYRQRGT